MLGSQEGVYTQKLKRYQKLQKGIDKLENNLGEADEHEAKAKEEATDSGFREALTEAIKMVSDSSNDTEYDDSEVKVNEERLIKNINPRIPKSDRHQEVTCFKTNLAPLLAPTLPHSLIVHYTIHVAYYLYH